MVMVSGAPGGTLPGMGSITHECPTTKVNDGRLARRKDAYIFTGMSGHLINVRLDETYLRKAQALRDRGIVISDLVREAIDERFDQLVGADEPREVKGLIARLFAEHPDDATHRPRGYDVHDRRAARAAIRKALSGART